MKYKILLINNESAFDPSAALLDVKNYFRQRTPLELEFEQMYLTKSVTLGKWGIKSKPEDGGKELVGTIGMRQMLVDLGVNGMQYNAVIFLYDLAKTDWFKSQPAGEELRHWAHWDPYKGATLIECATWTEWGAGDLYRIMTHELMHAYHQACRLNGTTLSDTMDLYDKEFEVEATDGNRARNIKTLSFHWELVPHQPLLAQILRTIALLVEAYRIKNALESMNQNIEKWALAVRKQEGWYKGSRSYRNNNPGNFRFYSGGYRSIYGSVTEDRSGVEDGQNGFAIFPSYKQGWTYLCNSIKSYVDGTSAKYNTEAKKRFGLASSSDLTLYQLYEIYAPKEDGNNPKRYAEVVADELGVSPTTQIKNLTV